MLQLLRNRALRASEVCGLEYPDCIRPEQHIHVKRKGGEWSLLPTADEVWYAVMEWLDVRGEEPGPLFGISRWTVRHRVKARGKAIGIKLWPHALRHSGITHAASLGYSIKALKKFSAHENAQTLLIYIDLAKGEDVELAKAVGKKRKR